MTGTQLTEQEFRVLHARLRDQAACGPADRRGALRHLTPERTARAAAGVRAGRTVSLAAPIGEHVQPDNPEPAGHELTSPPPAGDGMDFNYDRFAMNVHGDHDSHLDALNHVAFDGRLYNDLPATGEGRAQLSVDLLQDGIAGRGVLLDIPAVRGTDWLEPGDHVTAADLEAAQHAQQAEVGPGDLVFVRVGHRRRRAELGPWDTASRRAGLHPHALAALAGRQIALLGSDGNSDTAPSVVAGVDFPVHVLAIQALGLLLADYLQFDELLAHCQRAARWSFLCVLAPLRLSGATGSPVNPIAIL